MTWSRLRKDQPDFRRRRSILRLDSYQDRDHTQDPKENEEREPDSLHITRTSVSVSDLNDQEQGLQTSVSHDQDPSAYGKGPQMSRTQRFSLLRFRHASDSQLSRTARDQSLTSRPPVPTGIFSLPELSLSPPSSPKMLTNPALQPRLSSPRRQRWSHLIRYRSGNLHFCFRDARSRQMPSRPFHPSHHKDLLWAEPPALVMMVRASRQITRALAHPGSRSMSQKGIEAQLLLQRTAMIRTQH